MRNCLVVAVLVGCLGTLRAEVLTAQPFVAEFDFAGRPMIIGGKPASALDYPASFRAGKPGHRCTWFLVASGTLVGAAHCVAGESPDDALATIELPIGDIKHTATCTISTGYWKDRSQDWAACRVSPPAPVPGAANAPVPGFEALNSRPEILLALPLLEISGFGCSFAGGPLEMDYQIGSARVEELPPNARVTGSIQPTPHAIKLRRAPQLLCEGDSGGPAFLYQTQSRSHRIVVGINSATTIAAGSSFISSVSTGGAKAFFEQWSKDNGQHICGLHKEAEGCRPFKP